MRCLSRKTGEVAISHRKESSLTLFPYLVTIDYLPGRKIEYFVMAENEKDAFHKIELTFSNMIKHYEKEYDARMIDKLKTIVSAMENNTKISLIDSNRVHKVIEFDAPIF